MLEKKKKNQTKKNQTKVSFLKVSIFALTVLKGREFVLFEGGDQFCIQ